MHVPSRNRATAVAVGLLLVLAGAPAAASAATAGVASGSTTLKLAPGTARALNALVSPSPRCARRRPAKAGVSFPVRDGSVDRPPAPERSSIAAACACRAGDRTVNLRNFVINAGSTNTIGVQVGRSACTRSASTRRREGHPRADPDARRERSR
jgi:hypothetical protein